MSSNLVLGKSVDYSRHYSLSPIPRRAGREGLGIAGALPFFGRDLWNAYELSWLDSRGKPVVAMGQFVFPCESEFLIESKSFKLFLNGFNMERFESPQAFRETARAALEKACGSKIEMSLAMPGEKNEGSASRSTRSFSSATNNVFCLDELPVEIAAYDYAPENLSADGETVEETLYSNLLKSNCPVTGQPDWGSVFIHYRGRRAGREGLLRYIVSYRNHHAFHEDCVERIFCDFLKRCEPEKLSVWAQYTRRGGLDINPYRSNDREFSAEFARTERQ